MTCILLDGPSWDIGNLSYPSFSEVSLEIQQNLLGWFNRRQIWDVDCCVNVLSFDIGKLSYPSFSEASLEIQQNLLGWFNRRLWGWFCLKKSFIENDILLFIIFTEPAEFGVEVLGFSFFFFEVKVNNSNDFSCSNYNE